MTRIIGLNIGKVIMEQQEYLTYHKVKKFWWYGEFGTNLSVWKGNKYERLIAYHKRFSVHRNHLDLS